MKWHALLDSCCQRLLGVQSAHSLILLVALFVPGLVAAGEVQVAVAANFTAPAKVIAAGFEQETGHKALLSFGATGKFYAQIANGAPFEVLLAADADTPARLEREGRGVAGSRFTYAIGKLVLWSARPGLVDARGEVLKKGDFAHIALAEPKLAPYGAAAMAVLSNLGVLPAVSAKIVRGENIAQTCQFVVSGNAELGFVALSQVMKEGVIGEGSAWVVPADLYPTIRQDAIILDKGKVNPAARAWIDYLKGDKARGVMRASGYAF
ncbi:MAG: molybdate ABC transporter substrate-binding protein [Magnetococcales bacterium]|nr:molybdate ABC transporter substrate-binding protein [Magnetococcales bacterium]